MIWYHSMDFGSIWTRQHYSAMVSAQMAKLIILLRKLRKFRTKHLGISLWVTNQQIAHTNYLLFLDQSGILTICQSLLTLPILLETHLWVEWNNSILTPCMATWKPRLLKKSLIEMTPSFQTKELSFSQEAPLQAQVNTLSIGLVTIIELGTIWELQLLE